MSSLSILIVDDDELDRELLRRDLQRTRLDITLFERGDGQQALDFFSNYAANRAQHGVDFPPLITFLDLNMPVLSGFEFLAAFDKLREQAEFQACVIIIFSSSAADDDQRIALGYEFVVDYLEKGEFGSTVLKQKLTEIAQSARR